MTIVKIAEGHDEIYNDAGMQVIGSYGPNLEGLSPRELMEAALGLCITISLRKIMDYDGVAFNKDEVSVEVAASKPEDKTNRFSDFRVHVTLPSSLDEAYKTKLMSVVERACTVGNTIRTGAVVDVQVRN